MALFGNIFTQAGLVDALPYIDQGYDEHARSDALAMIESECKLYRPTKNYLDYLPPANLDSFMTDVMKAEFDRIHSRQPMELMNMKRYELPDPPAGKLTDLSAWAEAVENSQAQLEHQQIRIENLELMMEYGCESWKSYNMTLRRMVDQYQKQLANVKKEIQDVNYQRKREQTNAGEKLKSLEESWVGLISKNYEIELTVASLEDEVRKLKKEQNC